MKYISEVPSLRVIKWLVGLLALSYDSIQFAKEDKQDILAKTNVARPPKVQTCLGESQETSVPPLPHTFSGTLVFNRSISKRYVICTPRASLDLINSTVRHRGNGNEINTVSRRKVLVIKKWLIGERYFNHMHLH